ncbi:Dabb family protein [Arthrobacter sp. 2MCAF15]|uniref:Dabb family protein n=1 Tax=Arthrobacter sp. 2MCAF15 TaxID=3232984 RepID=UPI003F90C5BB
MFYQLVSFTFPDDIPHETRSAFEDALRSLPGKIPNLEDARVIRASDDANVTGYVSVFGSEADYQSYLDHPEHGPIGTLAERVCSQIRRLLLDDDRPSVLAPRQQDEQPSHSA